MAVSTAISQLSCFSAVHRSLHLRRRSLLCPSPRSKLSVVMSLERHDTDTAGSDTKNTLSYAADVSKLHVQEKQSSYSTKDNHDAEKIGTEATQETVGQPKKTAKIHDFCLGIPFGGFILTGGIIEFLFSRSPATLSSGVLFGGALLFLSTLSLKVWRQGKSSLPFILGQAALSGLLIWKNFQSYSLAKKIFPAGFSAIIRYLNALLLFYLIIFWSLKLVIVLLAPLMLRVPNFGLISLCLREIFVCSSAMLCFYLYVLTSGGNPPPKKLKPSASIA
ncbi:hypothetical protein Fmac_029680 [Flemingia macrophylla]|uniref:Protein FATTY ACID EXPORT 1, chloroplastic n=1 Tax=Flemingia macrophylla TaxID=520843 RepID=A0ABD1LB12_9FABA